MLLKAITELSYVREWDDKTKVAISDFKLTEEKYSKMDVFIELDEEAKQIGERYMHMKEIEDLCYIENKDTCL